ncbi:MAG: hypothetical protein AAGA62_18320, partial [Bacteroidota bacterium]
PIFDLPNAYCSTTESTVLPSTSEDGYVGQWFIRDSLLDGNLLVFNDELFDLFIFEPYVTWYPDPGQCVDTVNHFFSIDPARNPFFFSLATEVCVSEGTFSLPSTSTNGFAGSWSSEDVTVTNGQADISGAGGMEVELLFTPDPDQCALPRVHILSVTGLATPSFSLPASACELEMSITLPTTSDNGYNGNWTSEDVTITNGQADISEAGGTDIVFLFTPNTSLCVGTSTYTLSVTTAITPTFSLPDSVCPLDVSIPLPEVSDNGVTGSWEYPDGQPTDGNFNFGNRQDTTISLVFVSNDGQCAKNGTVSIYVTETTEANVLLAAEVCVLDGSLELPAEDSAGIAGTWQDALGTLILDNSIDISLYP